MHSPLCPVLPRLTASDRGYTMLVDNKLRIVTSSDERYELKVDALSASTRLH